VENENQKESNIALTHKQRQLRVELGKEIESSRLDREKLVHLQSEIKGYEHSIKSYENSIRSYEEVESDLKKSIVCKKNAMEEHEEASTNGETPGFETFKLRTIN
jgi:hypothetical protein